MSKKVRFETMEEYPSSQLPSYAKDDNFYP